MVLFSGGLLLSGAARSSPPGSCQPWPSCKNTTSTTTTLAAPTNLVVADVTDTNFSLSWAASSGANGYRIYQDNVLVWTLTDGTTSLWFGNRQCGTTYQLGVEAFDSTSVSSRSTASATTLACATTTTPIGSIVYSKNFDDGLIDSGGWGHQCRDTLGDYTNGGTIRRGTLTVDTSTFDGGTSSGRFDLPADTVRQACEMLHERTPNPGTNDWFSVAIRYPTNYVDEEVEGAGMQLNYQGFSGGAVNLASRHDYLSLNIIAGDCDSVPGCPYFSGYAEPGWGPRPAGMPGPLFAIPSGQRTLGVWHELVIHVYWTTDLDGVVEAWHKEKGQSTWTKTVDTTTSGFGFPTLQWGTSPFTFVTPQNIASQVSNDKFGMYRQASSYPTNSWFDGFCRATSFAAAESCLS
jgi:hypothetical protein